MTKGQKQTPSSSMMDRPPLKSAAGVSGGNERQVSKRSPILLPPGLVEGGSSQQISKQTGRRHPASHPPPQNNPKYSGVTFATQQHPEELPPCRFHSNNSSNTMFSGTGASAISAFAQDFCTAQDLLPPAPPFRETADFSAASLTGDFRLFEKERREILLQQLAQNIPGVAVLGSFREYEDYGLPGYAPMDRDHVRALTFALMQALTFNTHVTEFVLNVKALELLLVDEDGLSPLLYFLQNNPSLTTLNIRVPPGTKESGFFVGLFSSTIVACRNLKDVTLWIPRERPQSLRLMRMMRRDPNAVSSTNHTLPLVPPSALSTLNDPSSFSLPVDTTRYQPSPMLRRLQQPVDSLVDLAPKPVAAMPAYASIQEVPSQEEEDYDLSGIAHFVALQPRLKYVRIQASSLTLDQWTSLAQGLSTSRSLKHVELRRVEVDSPAHDPTMAASLALLGRRLERLDLHGTSVDVSPLMELKNSSSKEYCALATLSWSSANLIHMDRLMHALSLPSATLRFLELSHLNLSGPKCQLLADMLKRNTSIRHLNVSRAQLDSVDAYHLCQGLLHNRTLRQLNLMDNYVWRSAPNAAHNNSFLETERHKVTPTTTYSTLAFEAFQELLEADTPLESLDLSDNGLDTLDQDSRYGQLLCGLESNSRLVSLKLCNQANLFLDTLQTMFGGVPRQFHASVSQRLGNVLGRNCIQELVLNYNRFNDEHLAEFVAPALKGNTTLRILGLKRTGMGNDSMIQLAQALVNHPSLESLDVSYNIQISDDGYKALSKTVRTLPKLHTLWFHTMARHREEDALAQHRYTLIVAKALEVNTSIKQMSHVEVLDDLSRLYLQLNQYDRQRLCGATDDPVPQSLWPKLLASMPLELVAFYVRRNAPLLASVTSHPPAQPATPKPPRQCCTCDQKRAATAGTIMDSPSGAEAKRARTKDY